MKDLIDALTELSDMCANAANALKSNAPPDIDAMKDVVKNILLSASDLVDGVYRNIGETDDLQ